MPLYLVEAYTPTEALLPEIEARICRATRRTSADGAVVCHLRTIFIPGDQTCFHLIDAPSSDQARAVAELATLEAQRVVEAVEHEPRAAQPASPAA